MRSARSTAVAVLLILASAGAATDTRASAIIGFDGSFEEMLATLQARDYDTGLALIVPLAEDGDALAQFWLGSLYRFGVDELPQDLPEAASWLRLAAQQGYPEAQFMLGQMFDDGLGVPQDYVEAANWYRRAALQDHSESQYNLARKYELGQGIQQDFVQAQMWLNILAARTADMELRERAISHNGAAMQMSDQQLSEAMSLAIKWRPTHIFEDPRLSMRPPPPRIQELLPPPLEPEINPVLPTP